MATTFVKNGTNVLVTIGTNDPISAPGNAFISPHPSEDDVIMISEKFNPQNRDEALKIYVSDVTLPVNTGRADLIAKLSTDFFFRVVGSGGTTLIGGYLIIPDSETSLNFRLGIRSSQYVIDKELTATGYE